MNKLIYKEIIGELEAFLNGYLEKEKGTPPSESAWLGKTPLVKADTIVFTTEQNFRLSPEIHGQYQMVWFCEYNLFSTPNWPLIFDETLRLLEEVGTLVIRTEDNQDGTIYLLKSYLFRRYDIDAKILKQFKIDDQNTISVYGIKRLYFRNIKNSNWTIGVITNGRKKNNVINLVNKSVKLAKALSLKIEFIIAGPFNPNHTQSPQLVRVIDLNNSDNLARITEKKLLISQQAAHENIAIFHDRYQINDDFFVGFQQFGYDFNFLTVSQSYEDGSFYPGYPGFNRLALKQITPQFDTSPDTLYEGQYINGGIMIFKKTALGHIPFNPLLLHNEAEDVELSFLLRQSGIIPRLNIFSSAVSIDTPITHTETFLNLSSCDSQKQSASSQQDFFHKVWRKLLKKEKKEA